jgi:hypothetical protein
VRELVRVHPTRVLVQVFVATNVVVPLALGARVTAVGVAVILGFGVEHAVANSGEASVGAVSLPEHAARNNPGTTSKTDEWSRIKTFLRNMVIGLKHCQ